MLPPASPFGTIARRASSRLDDRLEGIDLTAYQSGRLDMPKHSGSGRLDLGSYQSGRLSDLHPAQSGRLDLGRYRSGRMHDGDVPAPMPQKDLRPKASSHFPPAAPLRTSSTGGPQQAGAKGRCAGWRNPQQWLMLAMSLLAMFIFAVRFYQSRHFMPDGWDQGMNRERSGGAMGQDELEEWMGHGSAYSAGLSEGRLVGASSAQQASLAAAMALDAEVMAKHGELNAGETDVARKSRRSRRRWRDELLAGRQHPRHIEEAELAAAEEPHAVGFAGRVREGFSAGRAQRDGRAGLRRDGAGARAGGGDAAGDGARERRGGAQGSKGVGGVGGYLNAAVVMQGLGGQVAGGVGQEEEGEGGGGGARTGFGVDDMDDDGAELPAIGTLRPKALPMIGEAGGHVGIDEVVRHTDKPDDVASKDPEMRMWDALDAGTHTSDTLADAMAEHLQVDETVGFQEGEGEDPMEDPMAVAAAEALAAGDAAAWQQELADTDDEVAVRPPEETSFSEIRVVGGANMMEERPVTEGLTLFDTGVKAIQEPQPGAAKEEPAEVEEAVVEEVEGVEAEAEEGSSAEEAAKKSPWSWVKFLTGSQGHGSQAGDVGSTPGSSAEATGGEAGLAQRYQDAMKSLRGRAGFSGELKVGEGQS